MVVTLESDAVDYNKRVVLASTIVVLIISNTSYVLRLWARRKQNQRLQLDDYLMGLALPFSYIPAVCLLYGEVLSIQTSDSKFTDIFYRLDCRTWRTRQRCLEKGPEKIQHCVSTLHSPETIMLIRSQVIICPAKRKSTLPTLREVLDTCALLPHL
jgi:hypothetical protein